MTPVHEIAEERKAVVSASDVLRAFVIWGYMSDVYIVTLRDVNFEKHVLENWDCIQECCISFFL